MGLPFLCLFLCGGQDSACILSATSTDNTHWTKGPSTDGLHWTKEPEPVFAPGGQWDRVKASEMCLMQLPVPAGSSSPPRFRLLCKCDARSVLTVIIMIPHLRAPCCPCADDCPDADEGCDETAPRLRGIWRIATASSVANSGIGSPVASL